MIARQSWRIFCAAFSAGSEIAEGSLVTPEGRVYRFPIVRLPSESPGVGRSGGASSDLNKAAAEWVDEHGDCLYRYALARIRKPQVAEDLVQETFLAAVRGYEKFGGRSSVRSWLVGILKHKIIDHYRKAGRETSFTDLEFFSDENSDKFVAIGFWKHEEGPHEWQPDASEVMQKGEFWKTMRGCLGKLPERVASVFSLREMEGVPSKEICALLSISESNLWVMLHRARMALRECLEMNWFNPDGNG
jgi:RNA polymerase sigma-70 factor (ECF subfamily)